MLNFFDTLFVKIHNQYIVWKEKDIPHVYSILILSLFQSLNIISILILAKGLFEKGEWILMKWQIIVIMIAVLAVDYIRIFKIIGLKNIVNKFTSNNSISHFHIFLYFLISIAFLIALKLVNFFPVVL